jgi:integrase/recombinase XerD
MKGFIYMNKEPTFEELRDDFMRSLVLENRSPSTVQGVKSPLNIFFRFLRGQGINSIKQVTSEVIEDYRRWMYRQKTREGEPYAPSTIVGRLVVLFRFFQYLKKKGRILVDPTFGMDLPKSEVKIPRDVMNGDEIKLMLDQPDIRDPIGYRDRTIMEVLYSTGVRNQELRDIKLSDVNLIKREIKIEKGKGDKARIVPLNQVAVRFLEGYLTRIRPYLVTDDRQEYLFVAVWGGRMYATELGRMIKRYREQAGITKQITPHSFRHTMATQLLEAGMNVRYIQAILGHTSLKSTQVYTRVAVDSLNEKHRKYHPREKMRRTRTDWREGEARMFRYTEGVRASEIYPWTPKTPDNGD